MYRWEKNKTKISLSSEPVDPANKTKQNSTRKMTRKEKKEKKKSHLGDIPKYTKHGEKEI